MFTLILIGNLMMLFTYSYDDTCALCCSDETVFPF